MVDLLNAAKNIISGKSPDTPPVASFDNRIDRIDQCKIVWYQWQNELSTTSKNAFGVGNTNVASLDTNQAAPSASASDLAKAFSYDISNHIESFSYSKSMDAASGVFQFTLHNSFDWSRFMKPGQWILGFLAGDGSLPLPEEKSNKDTLGLAGLNVENAEASAKFSDYLSSVYTDTKATASTIGVPKLPLPESPNPATIATMKKKLRCIGIIQRVGIRSTTSIDGTIEISYIVTGKDFGTIYEETDLWFNANSADGFAFSAAIQSITTIFARNLTSLLDKWHDIFLSPSNTLAKTITNATAFFPQQWILPDKMATDLALPLIPGGEGFFGNIANLKEFSPTVFENSDPLPLAGMSGRCWERLKNLSQPEFHELFTELGDNGNPKLYFRPIPWALDKSRYPTLGSVMLSYKDLTSDQDVKPPTPLGSTAPNFVQPIETQDFSFATTKTSTIASGDIRLRHSVSINSTAVDSFDIGPDYHSRSNFFLVDSVKSQLDQTNVMALTIHSKTPFPLRDESDIKRYGFKPRFAQVNCFLITNESLFKNEPFGDSPQENFMLEANEIFRDFYANAEDFYSGTMNLTAAKNEVKLGKVLLTDGSFDGIPDMVFYIEGYTDSFFVNSDGTGSWNQNLILTRGMQTSVLDGGSSKDRQATQVETFHTFNKGASSSNKSTLSKVKNAIKNPKSLF